MVVGGTSLVAANATTEPDHSCTATYVVKRAWATGFSAAVTVENTGDNPVDDWAVNWSLGGSQTVVDGWQGVWSQDEGRVTVEGGAPLEPGRKLTVNFTGWHPAGKAPSASGFALNGVKCHVSEGEDGQQGASPGPSSVALPPGAPASPVPGPKPSVAPGASAPSGPLGSLYVDSDGGVVDWVTANAGDARAAVIRARIARKPQARWFGNESADGVASDVRAYTARAAGSGKVPVLVAYNMTNRDCGGASAGGASSADDYRAWIRGFASGLGSGTSIIVLEPDALPHLTDCLSADQQSERLALLSYAGQVIKAASPKARIYYDVGHSKWLNVSDAATRSRAAGVTKYGAGIALNTSNYNTNSDEVAYGKQVLAALGVGRLQMVVDTSRNGAGPAADGAWCDPEGRRLGTSPTTQTGDSKVAAFLWVKRPGESDGCSGAAGQFIAATAYALSA